MVLTGRCYCGNVSYKVNDDIATDSAVVCHCETCLRLHSNSSVNVKTELDKIEWTGQPKVFEDKKANSGKRVRRFFCGDCGSALASAPDAMPGVAFLKLGSADNATEFKPTAEIYVEQAYPHALLGKHDRNLKSFEGMMSKEVQL